jgi:hypothetical protein
MDQVPRSLGTLTLRDAGGECQVLYAGTDLSVPGGTERFAMPPPPPAGIFDARFASDRIAELLTPGAEPVALHLSSATYPVTIRWSSGEEPLEAVLLVGGRPVRLGNGGTLTITDARSSLGLTLGMKGAIPSSFALENNYPNPFNPETRINFALPQTVSVAIRVFSVLGEEVAVLHDGPMVAGYHSVTWDGRTHSGLNAGSGVYFVRLEASSGYSATRKMMLVR